MFRGIALRLLVAVAAIFVFATLVSTTSFLHAADEKDSSADAEEAAPVATPGPDIETAFNPLKDRSHFMGSRACLDCHRSEYVAWLGTQHFKNSKNNRFEATKSSIDTKYKKEVGNLDLCYKCHNAPAEQRFGRTLVETGVSCESCHGAAGGENGWLNRHAVYGPNVTRLEHETPQHLAERNAFCDTAGMVRSNRPYEVAKNCFGCHIIADATLTGEDVKHPVSFDKFSLIPYMQGEIRHNFHTNQRDNSETPTLDTLRRGQSLEQRKRVYFILEQFAKAEVALTHIATLPNDEAIEEYLADEMIDLFDNAAGELEDFFDELEEPEDEDIAGLSEEELAPLMAVIDAFEEFDDLDEPTRADAAASAKIVADAAAAFLMLHDGSKLKAVDEAFLEDLDEPVGKALKP